MVDGQRHARNVTGSIKTSTISAACAGFVARLVPKLERGHEGENVTAFFRKPRALWTARTCPRFAVGADLSARRGPQQSQTLHARNPPHPRQQAASSPKRGRVRALQSAGREIIHWRLGIENPSRPGSRLGTPLSPKLQLRAGPLGQASPPRLSPVDEAELRRHWHDQAGAWSRGEKF